MLSTNQKPLQVLLLVTCILTSSCADKKSKADSAHVALPADSANVTVQGDVAPVKDVLPPPITNPCTFSGAATDCRGVVEAGFINSPSIAALRQAVDHNDFKSKENGVYRKFQCPTGQSCDNLFGKPYVNRDMRRFTWTDLPSDKAIVFGAIRYSANKSAVDGIYKFGNNIASTPEHKRFVFFVAYKPATRLPEPSTYGTPVAAWRAFAIERGSNNVIPVGNGYILVCKIEHDDTLKRDTLSAFVGCEGEPKIVRVALATGASLEEILTVGHCKLAELDGSNPPSEAVCSKRRQDALAAFSTRSNSVLKANALPPAELQKLLSALAYDPDETGSTYWFPCANGCCSAGMIQ